MPTHVSYVNLTTGDINASHCSKTRTHGQDHRIEIFMTAASLERENEIGGHQ